MRRKPKGVCQDLVSCFLLADPANLATFRLFSQLMKTICSKTKSVWEEYKLPTMVYVPLRFENAGQLLGNDVRCLRLITGVLITAFSPVRNDSLALWLRRGVYVYALA